MIIFNLREICLIYFLKRLARQVEELRAQITGVRPVKDVRSTNNNDSSPNTAPTMNISSLNRAIAVK